MLESSMDNLYFRKAISETIRFTFFDSGVGMEMSNCEAKIIHIERMILWEISLDFIIIGHAATNASYCRSMKR